MEKTNKILKLEDILDRINLSNEEKKFIHSNEQIKQFKNLTLDSNIFFKITKLILEYNENVEKQIKEKKKEKLISDIYNKVIEHENLLKSYFKLLSDSKGIYLYNKTLSYYDNSIDDSLNDIVKAIIINIIKSDFKYLFNQHDYYLNLINKLSRISLKILTNYNNWPTAKSGAAFSVGDMIITNWEKRFSEKYAEMNNFQDQIEMDIILQCIIELRDYKIIEYKRNQGNKKVSSNVILTNIGINLIKYLELE